MDQKLELNILDIHWNDILFSKIFPYISMTDIFRLQMVSRTCQVLVKEYSLQCKHIRMSHDDVPMPKEAFIFLTASNTVLKTIAIPHLGSWLTDEILIPVICACIGLSELRLSNCMLLTNKSLVELCTHCHNITKLSLSKCSWVEPDSFCPLILGNHDLISLDVSGCTLLDDKCIELMARSCHFLQEVNIAHITGLTDISLEFLGKMCPKLSYLNVAFCFRLTDTGIEVIREYCKGLRMIKCKNCPKITEDSLGKLRCHVEVDVPPPLNRERLLHTIDYALPVVRQVNHNM